MLLRLSLLLVFMLPSFTPFGQSIYKDGTGFYLNNGIGYRFANSIDVTATFGEDAFDRQREKIRLSGSLTNFLNQSNTWGYTIGTGLSYLTNDIPAVNKFTPNINSSLFRKIKLSESFDLIPSLSTFISFPEFEHQAFGAEFILPVSIKVFNEKRFIIGPGIAFGRTNVNSIQIGQDSFQVRENVFQVGLTLGFNF